MGEEKVCNTSTERLEENRHRIPGFLQIVDLHNKDGSVKLRNINSPKKFAAQGILFSFDEYEEEDEESAVEKDVEDSGAGDTKKSYEDRMEEKGREIAAIIQQIAKPFPVVWGYLNNDAETEKKMSDVIGVAATDEIVAQMYNEHFEQETFKSDVAKAVINTYYNDAEVVSTTKRLVCIQRGYSMSMIHNIIHTSYNRMHGHGAVRYATYVCCHNHEA
eukprot:scaffold8740_cov172-Skeletonema_dohrnii-CCMP3373.AAC.1